MEEQMSFYSYNGIDIALAYQMKFLEKMAKNLSI